MSMYMRKVPKDARNSLETMAKSKRLPKVKRQNPPDDHDHLEVIRFTSDEARRQAIGALMHHGMLNFTSYRHNEWLVRTDLHPKTDRRNPSNEYDYLEIIRFASPEACRQAIGDHLP